MPPPPFRPERYRFCFSLKRRCWWAEGAAEGSGGKVKWRERGESRGQREGERQQQKLELEVAACLRLPLCLKLHDAVDLQSDSNRASPHLLCVRRSVPNLSLPSPKWSWSEKASGRGGGDEGSLQKWARAATHYLLCVGYSRSASDLRRGFVEKLPGFCQKVNFFLKSIFINSSFLEQMLKM